MQQGDGDEAMRIALSILGAAHRDDGDAPPDVVAPRRFTDLVDDPALARDAIAGLVDVASVLLLMLEGVTGKAPIEILEALAARLDGDGPEQASAR